MELSTQERPAKRLRMTRKTNAQTATLSVLLEGEDTDAVRAVYLVALPHLSSEGGAAGGNLVAPGTMSREAVRDAVIACCRAPEHDPVWLRRHPGLIAQPIFVKQLVVLREYHARDHAGVRHVHYHVALLLGRPSRFMPLKRALVMKYHVASNWSCSHDGYWSAVGYGIRATPHKPMAALDPAPLSYSSAGPRAHPPLEIAATQPTTAAAVAARRKHQTQVAGEKGTPEPRVDDIDLWPVIVSSGVRKCADEPFAVQKLMAYAKSSCSPKIVAWLFKNQERLSSLIDKVWAWERVDAFLADATKPRLQQLLEARQWPCICGGRWPHFAQQSLTMNRIASGELCRSVMESLERGRSEDVQVPTLAGRFGGEGKSFLFAPLRPLYGADHVQERPAGGQFSMLGVDGKKVTLLDEWTFLDEDLPVPMQLLWLEGKPVPVQRPQSQHVGHALYQGTAPIFITTPEDALSGLSTQSAEQPRGHAGMLLRRLKIFFYSVPVPKPPPPRVHPCPRCFACLVTTEASRR